MLLVYGGLLIRETQGQLLPALYNLPYILLECQNPRTHMRGFWSCSDGLRSDGTEHVLFLQSVSLTTQILLNVRISYTTLLHTHLSLPQIQDPHGIMFGQSRLLVQMLTTKQLAECSVLTIFYVYENCVLGISANYTTMIYNSSILHISLPKIILVQNLASFNSPLH